MSGGPELTRTDFFACLLFLLIPFALFSHTLSYDFIFLDDYAYVPENTLVKNLSWSGLRDLFGGYQLGNYIPLSLLSYAFEYPMWGLRPYGYRLTNLFLHAFNGILLYLWLRRMEKRIEPVFFVALLFLIHPVQLESFLWVAERKAVLSTFFFLLGLISYVEFRSSSRPIFRSSATLCFFLAFLAKPVSLVFPLVLFAYDFFYLRWSSFWKLVREHLPYFLIAFCMGLIHIGALTSAGYVPFKTERYDLLKTFVSIPVTIFHYMVHGLFPFRLSLWYDPVITGSVWRWDILLTSASCGFVLTYAFVKWWKQQEEPFWLGWFLIFLLPVLHIVPFPTTVQDRYLYLPLVGLGVLGTLALLGGPEEGKGAKVRRAFMSLFLCGLLLGYGWLSWKRSFYWRDTMLLYLDAVQKAPLNHRGHFYLANEWLKRGQYDLADLEIDRALHLAQFPDYYQTKALVQYFREDYAKALVLLQKAIHLWPKPSHYVTRSQIYRKMGKIDEAIADCLQAIQMDSRLTRAYVALGRLYDEQGKFENSREAYQQAMLLDPDFQHQR